MVIIKTFPFTTKYLKYLGIILIKELRTSMKENTKSLKKEIEEETKKMEITPIPMYF